MNKPIPITERLYWVGENDRETALFEHLWPLPRGVSYNSYLLIDEKVVLFDTVKDFLFEDFLKKIFSSQSSLMRRLAPRGGSMRFFHTL